jgi:serine/threonine protein kinase
MLRTATVSPSTHPSRSGSTSGFGLGSVPQDRGERTAFLQNRIALYGKTVTIISSGFFLVAAITALVLMPDRWFSAIFGFDGIIHLVSIGVFAVAWLVGRRSTLSYPALERADTLLTVLGCTAYAAMVSRSETDTDTLVALLATFASLIARAVLVPSTARRTLVVSLVAVLPTIVVTYYLGVKADASTASMIGRITYVSTWSAVAVALSTLASRVIFGLEEKVREARQLGQYTLAERIGAGGMGIVYRAHHAMLRRPTAVKVLPPEKMGRNNLMRFEREVQLTSQLTHPNTVAIYDYGRTPEGLFYYAMEYLQGCTLNELVELCGPLPPARVAFIIQQAAGSLAEAHRIGLIHRDIKPDNILVCDRGGWCDMVKVLDFGLVKDIGSDVDPALSRANTIIGTPLYLAPEAITAPETVSAASDLYALGAVAYYLLTGRHVFGGDTLVEICLHHISTPPIPPSVVLGRKLPSVIEELTLACLAKAPEGRPNSAEEIEQLLSQADLQEPWTQAQARAWWSEHRADLQRLRTERQPSETSSQLSSVRGAVLTVENPPLLSRALD